MDNGKSQWWTVLIQPEEEKSIHESLDEFVQRIEGTYVSARPSKYTCFLDASWLNVNERIGITGILRMNNQNRVVVCSRGSLPANG